MSTSYKQRVGLYTTLVLFSAVLIGCSGGGSEGGSVGVSDGQDPDPAVLDVAIAYVMRPLPVDDSGSVTENDLRDPAAFNPGAALFVRDRASPSSAARNITAGVFPDGELYDVKDLSASYDGERLLFSMRAPEIEDVDEDEQPSWNIWEYNMANDELRRIVTSNLSAEEGQDISPQYLADNSIVFTSTRQRESRALLLDEGKPQFAALDENRQNESFVLHKMDEQGGEITQLTFNQSHDMTPSVLDDGRILFSRWDAMGARNSVNLYTINPDGSGLQILYGNHSHDTGTNGATVQFMQAQQNDDGQIVAALRPFDTLDLGGEIVAIDTENFTDQNQPTAENAGQSGPAQQSASLTDVVLDQAISPGGR
ncbi:MAG: TolB family protein, partial [Pseudomonadales bacterium]